MDAVGGGWGRVLLLRKLLRFDKDVGELFLLSNLLLRVVVMIVGRL